jgi:hypothetical protein
MEPTWLGTTASRYLGCPRECCAQPFNPVRQRDVASPVRQSYLQALALLAAQLDRTDRAYGIERFADRLGVGDEAQLLEQEVALALGDVDLFGRETDSNGVEARGHLQESTP